MDDSIPRLYLTRTVKSFNLTEVLRDADNIRPHPGTDERQGYISFAFKYYYYTIYRDAETGRAVVTHVTYPMGRSMPGLAESMMEPIAGEVYDGLLVRHHAES